ncbi:O-antigen ligase family protein [Vibrio sp.]|nr:O-antigen ligase family protein [Vibrio sp.]
MNIIAFVEKYAFFAVCLLSIGIMSAEWTSSGSLMDKGVVDFQDKLTASSSFKQLFWIGLAGFCFWRVLLQSVTREERDIVRALLVVTILFFGISMVSYFWSAKPFLTFKRSIFQGLYVFCVCFSVYLSAKHKTIYQSIQLMALTLLAMCFASLVLGSGFSAGGEFSGYLGQKNMMGSTVLCVILMLGVIQGDGFKVKARNAVFIALTGFLILTESKTSLGILVFFILCHFLPLAIIRGLVFTIFLGCFVLFVFYPAVTMLLGEYWNVGQDMDPDAITGRGLIWKILYYHFDEANKELLGWGYGAYFKTGAIPKFFDIQYSFLQLINTAHNGYLGLLLQLGYLGMTAMFGIILYAASHVKTKLYLASLFLVIIHNVTESSFFNDDTIVWFFFISIVSISIVKQYRSLD